MIRCRASEGAAANDTTTPTRHSAPSAAVRANLGRDRDSRVATAMARMVESSGPRDPDCNRVYSPQPMSGNAMNHGTRFQARPIVITMTTRPAAAPSPIVSTPAAVTAAPPVVADACGLTIALATTMAAKPVHAHTCFSMSCAFWT